MPVAGRGEQRRARSTRRDRRPGPPPTARRPPARRPSFRRLRRPREPLALLGHARRLRQPRGDQDGQVAHVGAARRRAAPRPPRATSSALPTQRPSGWSIAVTSPAHRAAPGLGEAAPSAPRPSRAPRRRRAKNAPLPDLDVEHDGPGPAGELRAHDRGRDEARGGHRAGGVAQARTGAPRRVPGSDAWATTAMPASRTWRTNRFSGRSASIPGDRLQLVDRAAGVGQAAAAHGGHPHPQRRRQGRGDERHRCRPPHPWSAMSPVGAERGPAPAGRPTRSGRA